MKHKINIIFSVLQVILFFACAALTPLVPAAHGQCVEDDTGELDILGATGGSGSTVTHTLIIQGAPNEVSSLGFELVYDESILEYAGYVAGDCVDDFDFFDCNDVAEGVLRCGGLEAGQDMIPLGASCEVLRFQFKILDDTCESPACPAALTLQSLVDDIAGWSQSRGCFCCASDTLTTVSTTTVHSGSSGGGGSSNTTTSVPATADLTSTTTAMEGDTDESTTTTTFERPPADNETTTTTTIAKKRFCLFRKILGEDRQYELDAVRRFRDNIMSESAMGLSLIYLYYKHSPEAASILFSRPELLSFAQELVAELLPALDSGLRAGCEINLTKGQYDNIIELLQSIQVSASPGLDRSISLILEKLESGELLSQI